MLDKLVLFFIVSAVIGVAVSYSKLYLFHISYIMLFGYLVVHYDRFNIKKTIRDNYVYFSFFLFFFFWYGISIIWTISSITHYMKYLFYILMGVSISTVMIIYINSRKRLDLTFKALSMIFIIEILLSILEIHPDFQLPISPHSSLVHYFGRSGDNIITLSTVPTGFNWNQNDLGVVLVLIAPFIFFYKNIILKAGLSIILFIVVLKTGSFGNLFSLICISITLNI